MNRRGGVVAWVAVALLSVAIPGTAAEPSSGAPSFSLTGGVGNSYGWIGVQGERYLHEGRFSVFGGVGYASNFDEALETSGTVAAAAGVRAFFGGPKHRFFVEGSVALMALEGWVDESGSEHEASRYGPGLQVGYQLISRKGLTLSASIGAGYAVDARADNGAVLFGFAVGYTWRGH